MSLWDGIEVERATEQGLDLSAEVARLEATVAALVAKQVIPFSGWYLVAHVTTAGPHVNQTWGYYATRQAAESAVFAAAGIQPEAKAGD